jgi:probable F420-dependent oxidoreductase
MAVHATEMTQETRPRGRHFRFACRVSGGRGRTAAEWVALAQRAESLGYATFGVSDHFATQYAPMLLLQLAAPHTSTIRLTTLVLDNDFRHPAALAKEAATLDVLSGGRLELGIGAGWLVDEYRQAGLTFDTGATRLARLQEAVQILKLLFGEDPASFDGAFYKLDQLDGRPKPAQKPHPPLLIGGTRPRMLRFAATAADIVSFDSGPLDEPASWRPEALRRQAEIVHEAAGERAPELHLNPDVWGAGRPRRTVVEEAAQRIGVDPDDLDRSAYVLAGSTTEIVGTLERLREATGISYVTIPSDHIEAFAPVVDQLADR